MGQTTTTVPMKNGGGGDDGKRLFKFGLEKVEKGRS